MIYRALNWFFNIIEFAIFARVIVSWLPIPRDNQLIKFLYSITEPIMAPIRSIIDRSSFGRNMMFDFSPIIALLLIQFIRTIIGV